MQPHDDGYFGLLGSLGMEEHGKVQNFMSMKPDERIARLYLLTERQGEAVAGMRDDMAELKASVDMLASKAWWKDGVTAFGALGAVAGALGTGAIQAWRALH